jgi:beta-galactosidase
MSMTKIIPSTLLYGADYNPEQWPESVWQEDMRLMKVARVNMMAINIFDGADAESVELDGAKSPQAAVASLLEHRTP